MNETTGELHTCIPNTDTPCPNIGLYRQSSDGSSRREGLTTVVAALSLDPSGYQRIHGILDVTDDVADSSSVYLYVRRYGEGLTMLVDNVSLKLLPIRNDRDCDNLVFNGDFSVGDSRYWFDGDENALFIVSPGYEGTSDYALSSFEGNMEQYIRTGCMKLGVSYKAKASFKLIGANGNEFACRTRRATDDTKCPVLQIRVQVKGEKGTDTVARIAGDSSDTAWNTLLGGFRASHDFVNAESIRLQFVS